MSASYGVSVGVVKASPQSMDSRGHATYKGTCCTFAAHCLLVTMYSRCQKALRTEASDKSAMQQRLDKRAFITSGQLEHA